MVKICVHFANSLFWGLTSLTDFTVGYSVHSSSHVVSCLDSSFALQFLGQSNSQAAKLNTISNEELEPLKLYEVQDQFTSDEITFN